MGFEGLAAAGGASEGLETLLARMRAEEALRNQGRAVDIDAFNAQSEDTARRGTLAVQQGDAAERASEFAANAPVRQADVTHLGADTAHLNADTYAAATRATILKGLVPILTGQPPATGAAGTGAGAGAGATSPTPAAAPATGSPAPNVTPAGTAAPAAASGVASLDNPVGRLRLSVAGVPPNTVFKDKTEADKQEDAYAQSIGKTSGDQLTFADRVAMQKALPNYGMAQQRIGLQVTAGADAHAESGLRQRETNLRIGEAQQKLNQLPQLQREMALAEFQNRIKNDVHTQSAISQWVNGVDQAQDPGAQIDAIAADVLKKHGAPIQATVAGAVPAQGSATDLDAVLAARRAALTK